MHKFNMSFVFHNYILDRRLGFESTLQKQDRNSRALPNETRMRASILNIPWVGWLLEHDLLNKSLVY
jgi:hypothetical protein